ncbi:MAG TPA: hypothetical protein VK158_01350 [Acidobacteriota bacterium]|nr:hypothetical protein [Acidobacteriota bacterium]
MIASHIEKPGVVQRYSTRRLEQEPHIETYVRDTIASLRLKSLSTVNGTVSGNIEEFVQDLMSAWNEHNLLCDKIDVALAAAPADDTSYTQKVLVPLYHQMKDVDSQKRALSVLIKPHLEAHVAKVTKHPRELRTLLTPQYPSYWIERAYDLQKMTDYDFAHKYTRGSRILLERWKPRFYDESATVQRTANFSLSSLTPVQQLLTIDNTLEYRWTESLIGIPDYFLRERIAGLMDVKVNLFDTKEFDRNLENTLGRKS